eukprot:1460887-Karenia_brevis.AAC.1
MRTGLCVLWQCGYLGLRVGEASHPGPENQMHAADGPAPARVESATADRMDIDAAAIQLIDSDSDGALPSPFKFA